MLRTRGALASREPVFASFPVPCSKKIPYPPRIEVLPSPTGSHAKPTRGAGLKRCPFIQPSGVPLTPHRTSPNSVTTPGSSWNVTGSNAIGDNEALLSRTSPYKGFTLNLDGLKRFGSQFHALWYLS